MLLSPIKAKNLYLQFINIIKTDFDFETIFWLIKYVNDLKIHSYVLNWDCFYKKTTWKDLIPGCFVYPVDRSAFNGQSVLLPVWATPKSIDNYEKIKKFVFIVLWYPELRLENAKIQILNWIWKQNIRTYYKWYLKPVASKLAFKLKNYWFNIVDVWNATKIFDNNVGYVYNKRIITEELLPHIVWNIQYKTWDIKYSGSGFDMTLILWKKYLYNK